jgi:hypothetical protein
VLTPQDAPKLPPATALRVLARIGFRVRTTAGWLALLALLVAAATAAIGQGLRR